ncbi:MAG: hypothetical protein ACOCZE_08545, partial [Planctomycetota bacterium]
MCQDPAPAPVVCTTPTRAATSTLLCKIEPDGVIAQLSRKQLADQLIRYGAAMVNVSDVLKDCPVPRVVVDNVAVGSI